MVAGTPVFIQSPVFWSQGRFFYYMVEYKTYEICTDSIQRFTEAALRQWIDKAQ